MYRSVSSILLQLSALLVFFHLFLLVEEVDSMYEETKLPPSPHVCALKHARSKQLFLLFFFYIECLCKKQGEVGREEEGAKKHPQTLFGYI